MKILYLNDSYPPDSWTSPGILTEELAGEMVRRGYEISVITTVQKKSDAGVTIRNGVKVYKLYTTYHPRWQAYLSLYNPQTIGEVRRIIKDIKPDVCHFQNIHYYLSYHCLKIAKKECKKVFLTCHDVISFHYKKFTEFIDFSDLSVKQKYDYRLSFWQTARRAKKRFNPLRNIMIRHYFKYLDKVFSVSDELKLALVSNGIRNVETVYNGIDVNKFNSLTRESAAAFIDNFSLNNKRVILFGGRLSEAKGAMQAVAALGKVVKKIPDTVLLVAGDKNTSTEEMLMRAKENNLENNIILTGFLTGDEMKAAYYASNLVIVPSLCLDCFPTVNLEAMATKKPVIATCFGGSKEQVIDGATGFIINPLNIEMMAEKIKEILSNKDKAEEMGKQGYRRVVELFTIGKQADKLLSYYNR